jgi:hypothetical protein
MISVMKPVKINVSSPAGSGQRARYQENCCVKSGADHQSLGPHGLSDGSRPDQSSLSLVSECDRLPVGRPYSRRVAVVLAESVSRGVSASTGRVNSDRR